MTRLVAVSPDPQREASTREIAPICLSCCVVSASHVWTLSTIAARREPRERERESRLEAQSANENVVFASSTRRRDVMRRDQSEWAKSIGIWHTQSRQSTSGRLSLTFRIRIICFRDRSRYHQQQSVSIVVARYVGSRDAKFLTTSARTCFSQRPFAIL